MYLNKFVFPNDEQEFDFIMSIKRTCYDSYYPFKQLSQIGFQQIDFEPVTILHGGNGSGKTTALNVIAEALSLPRGAVYNQSNFFEDYVQICKFDTAGALPEGSRIITSDDVFDYMLDIRMLNQKIDTKREDMFDEYLDAKYTDFKFQSMKDIDRLRQVNAARSTTQSKYVRKNIMGNVREFSNGESALNYFSENIKENALYLLDEPENSLSPARQLELLRFLEDSVRFFGCQLVIATHSPFLLSLKNAKIYDLDEHPVDVKPWTALQNVRTYFDFFQSHMDDFT